MWIPSLQNLIFLYYCYIFAPDNLDDLPSLEAKVSRHGITSLDSHQLVLLQLVPEAIGILQFICVYYQELAFFAQIRYPSD
jgi:hypothetical protein